MPYKDPEAYKAYQRKYQREYARGAGKAARDDYLQRPDVKQKARERRARMDAKYPERKKARNAVNNAIRSGALIRQPCEGCGASPAQAHHDDYRNPLDVRWLCALCHGREHRINKDDDLKTADE